MKFVETSVFTRRVQKHLDDDSYRLLQHTLMLHPEMGNLIQGSGGVRVIYYWAVSKNTILIYGKTNRPT